MTGAMVVCKIADALNRTSSLHHRLRVSPDWTHNRILATNGIRRERSTNGVPKHPIPSNGNFSSGTVSECATVTRAPFVQLLTGGQGRLAFGCQSLFVFGLMSYPNECILGLDVYPRN